MMDLIDLRRVLHQYPEISGEEYDTSARIKEIFGKMDRFKLHELAGTGLLAELDTGTPGPSLLFRAELDALPIEEKADHSWVSKTPGKAHLCGHDGHMCFLVGLAQRMQSQPPAKGKVLLCFQPAEETGEGALRMLQDPKFEAFCPDLVFAIHNLPGFPKHQILWKEGAFTAAVESMVIRLHGKTSHAAEPEQGMNPAWMVADILKVSKSMQQARAMEKDFCLITPVHIAVGDKAYGVSAGYGELHFTLRTFDNDLLNRKKRDLIQFAELKGHKLGIEVEVEENIEPFRANHNSPKAMQEVLKAADDLALSNKKFVHPLRWGEDFGEFTSRFEGALIGLGAGEYQPALHNPDYDFPDDLIETGVSLFERIVRNKLH